MKLYYAPGACSLSCRIALHEAGIAARFERVDIKSKITEHGEDFTIINPKGYVPLLVLDDGEMITENIAVLDLIAGRAPNLLPDGPLGRTRLLEMLSWLSSELHIAFKPFWHAENDAEKAAASLVVAQRLKLVATNIDGQYLLGSRFTVADAYLFVMLRWARAFDVTMSSAIAGYYARIEERHTVRQALNEEGSNEPIELGIQKCDRC